VVSLFARLRSAPGTQFADFCAATNSLPTTIRNVAVSVHPRRAVPAAKQFLPMARSVTTLSTSIQLRVSSVGVRLPVYRIVLNDAESTRYYLDPTTGALLARLDTNRRWRRWLFGAIHRLDFAAWVRVRPAWDMILIADAPR